jgi:hypothetical protein
LPAVLPGNDYSYTLGVENGVYYIEYHDDAWIWRYLSEEHKTVLGTMYPPQLRLRSFRAEDGAWVTYAQDELIRVEIAGLIGPLELLRAHPGLLYQTDDLFTTLTPETF